jgi:hypothetical protein
VNACLVAMIPAVLALAACVPSLPTEFTADAQRKDTGEPAASCTCIATAAGWEPVALYTAAAQTQLPRCGDPYAAPTPSFGWEDLDQDAAVPTCPSCSCGPPTGNGCTGEVTWFTNACSGALGGCNTSAMGLATSACEPVENTTTMCHGKPIKAFTAILTATPGTCSPTATGSPTKPPLTGTAAEVCAPSSKVAAGACDAAAVCVPFAPRGSAMCFEKMGATECTSAPAGYGVKHVVQTVNDTRGCGNCGCGASTQACTAGTATFYARDASADGACATTPVSSASVQNGVCANLPDAALLPTLVPAYTAFAASADAGSVPEASCAVTEARPTGSVTLSQPSVYCCGK